MAMRLLIFHLKPSRKMISRRSPPQISLCSAMPFSAVAVPIASTPKSSDFFPSNPTEFDDSFKERLKQRSSAAAAALSNFDKVYQIIASFPDDNESLDAKLENLCCSPLHKSFVLGVLRHRPQPSLMLDPGNDTLSLRLRFFKWSGRQRGYRHTPSTFHAVFRLLSESRRTPLLLDWLRVLDITPSAFHSEARADTLVAGRPEFALLFDCLASAFYPDAQPLISETLVVGYSVAGRPDLALRHRSLMLCRGLKLDPFAYRILLDALVDASLFDPVDDILKHLASAGLANAVTHSIHVVSLCRQNKLDEARAFLSQLARSSPLLMRHKFTCRAVTMVVRSLCLRGSFDDVGRLVRELRAWLPWDSFIAQLVSAGEIDMAMEFLERRREEEGYSPESFHYNKLICQLLRNNELSKACYLLMKLPEQGMSPNCTTMNAAICSLCKNGMVDAAVELYNSMIKLGIKPNLPMLNGLISALCKRGSIDEIRRVLEDSIKQGYLPSGHIYDTFCREGRPVNMQKLLKIAHSRGFLCGSGVFASYVAVMYKAGNVDDACFLHQMTGLGNYGLGRYDITNIIRTFMEIWQAGGLCQLVIDVQEQGYSLSRGLYVNVVFHLCEMGMLDEFFELLDKQLRFGEPDRHTCYHYFIEGAAHAGDPELARELSEKMRAAGLEICMVTYILILKSYLKSGRTFEALTFFCSLYKKMDPSTKLYNVLVTGLCKVQKLEEAFFFWKEARENGLILSLDCYEVLVRALCSAKDYENTVSVLKEFSRKDRRVSTPLYNVLLWHALNSQAFCNCWVRSMSEAEDSNSEWYWLGKLIALFPAKFKLNENHEDLDEYLEKFFRFDICTYNMLLRVFTKAGRMDCACNLFQKFCNKGYVPNRWSFEIILRGFCKHGRSEDAKKWMMYCNGFHPTRCTEELYDNTK